MRWPGTRLLHVSEALHREFWQRRKEIARLHWDGAHPAYVTLLCNELREWVDKTRRSGFAGGYIVVI